MKYQKLVDLIKKRKSFLCVGLDPDPDLVRPEKIYDFNRKIIDQTRDYAIAYKPNIAFYEHLGPQGWDILYHTLNYLDENHFTIADAKRGDIGNTNRFYAKTYFETYGFDSITLNPYLGKDSVIPFLTYPDKYSIILALTSNNSSSDFQTPDMFKSVLEKAKTWGNIDNTMFVVGATKAESLKEIRKIVPQHFLLIPGVGRQGGNLDDVCKYGINRNCGLIVNSTRDIIYSNNPKEEAYKIQQNMESWLNKIGLVK